MEDIIEIKYKRENIESRYLVEPNLGANCDGIEVNENKDFEIIKSGKEIDIVLASEVINLNVNEYIVTKTP